jgi:hypothetical protein
MSNPAPALFPAHELKEKWLNQAFANAKIDRSRWRPGLGVEENRRIIEAVYDYYSRLFQAHPFLKWAGIASLIGPAFYAGFNDIGVVPDALRRVAAVLLGPISRRKAAQIAGELGVYETIFLVMQKQIFEDQAPMHEAYLTGGVSAIDELYRAAIIDSATLQAWRLIDRGRGTDQPLLVDSGSRTLLFREQYDIIDRFYVRMFFRQRPEGMVFTYLLTYAGTPSVPQAHSYSQEFPLIIAARLLRGGFSLRTPLPDGNIAVFSNRWRLIDADTFPDYLAFARDHRDQLNSILATSVGLRARKFRLWRRLGRLLLNLITGWRVHLLRSGGSWFRISVERAAQNSVAGNVAIDLRSWSSAAAPLAESGAQIWMNADRRPFPVAIALPSGKLYQAQAEVVTLFNSILDSAPDRLIIKLPDLDLNAAEQLLRQYAADWDFPAALVASWRNGCESRPSSDRQYSTQTFTGNDVGTVDLGAVRIEFQASHHVHENQFSISAIFSRRS